MQLQARELKWGLSANKWGDANCSDVEGTDDICEVIMFLSELKWVTRKFLGTKVPTMYIRVTSYGGYLIVLWLFYLVCILYCGCFNLFCNVWVCECMGFVMCGCMCGCFRNVYLYLPCFCIVSFICVCMYLYIYIYIQGVPGGMCQTSGGCSLC